MPTPVIQQIKAWSFSRWSTYEACPLRAKLKFINKRLEPSGPALERGSAIHKLAEEYTMGRLKRMPKELVSFRDEFKVLKKSLLRTEQQWAFDEDWDIVDWFDRDAWCRMVVDAVHEDAKTSTMRIIDYKTGKIRDEQMVQLDLYCMGGLLRNSAIKTVEAEFWYLDQGEVRKVVYTRKDLPKLKKVWIKNTRAMLADKIFAPRPGNACRWCHFRKDKGGPCEY